MSNVPVEVATQKVVGGRYGGAKWRSRIAEGVGWVWWIWLWGVLDGDEMVGRGIEV